MNMGRSVHRGRQANTAAPTLSWACRTTGDFYFCTFSHISQIIFSECVFHLYTGEKKLSKEEKEENCPPLQHLIKRFNNARWENPRTYGTCFPSDSGWSIC